MNSPKKVLFVCLGNICRSPSAEAVFRGKVEQAGLQDEILIDSAGTAAYHIGKHPDPRAIAAGAERGYDLSNLRARQVKVTDFSEFDYILAMDSENLSNLQAIMPANSPCTLTRMLGFSDVDQLDVPDPYYGGEQGFQEVLDLLESACEGLLNDIKGVGQL